MKENSVSSVIAKAIKSSKWVSIDYHNSQGVNTLYWIAVQDILINEKILIVDAFNASKMNEKESGTLKNIEIYFDRIENATLLPQTSYIQNAALIAKIDTYIDELGWLNYDEYNDDILDYIETCVKHEEVSYQEEKILVPGIDKDNLESFRQTKAYQLSITQMGTLIDGIELLSKQEKQRKLVEVTLALNLLSITTKRGNFVVAYQEVTFDPLLQSLVLSNDILFNYTFMSKDDSNFLPNLRNYLDVETDYFTELYLENKKAATDLLMKEVSKVHEQVDDRPYFMNLARRYDSVIVSEMQTIRFRKATKTLNVPLNAFFGNMSNAQLKRSRAVDVVLIDEKANTDQLRVIYNALVQPITYVQGPPGTGKTQTIINILISSFFNGQTVLVSSNNNKPIDDIYTKMKNIKDPAYRSSATIPFPILRLGNKERVLEALNEMRTSLETYERYNVFDEQLTIHAKRNKEKVKVINGLLEAYEERQELVENIESLEALLVGADLTLNMRLQVMISEKKERLKAIPSASEEEIRSLIRKADTTFLSWLFFTSVKNIKRLREPKYENLLQIIYSEDEDYKINEFNKYTALDDNLKLLQRIFPIILTTNQSAYRMGSQGNNFDLTIIDEAGQSSIGYALYAISRGERLLLVGDNNQLRPVVVLPPETNKALFKKYEVKEAYNYAVNSILSTMEKLDNISKFVMLRYHYRSRKAIIKFSNYKYYGNILKLMREDKPGEKSLQFINVSNKNTVRPLDSNFCENEVSTIVDLIKAKESSNVGVITPFVNQAKYIKAYLKDEGLPNVEVGTVHTFQGDEKETIIFSSAISKHSSDGAFTWLKNNEELINVALTRAKDKFILIGDYAEIKQRSPDKTDLLDLFDYVKDIGLTIPRPSEKTPTAIKRYLKSKREEELLETIAHVLSLNDYKYEVESNVRVASVLDNFTTPEKFDYGTRAEFDFVIYKVIRNQKKPVLVIELDGPEHGTSYRRSHNDKLKEKICEDNNIIIKRITNDYSRRYLYIKDMLKGLLK